MKRALALILSLCAVLLMFTACSTDGKDENATTEPESEVFQIGEEVFKGVTATDLDGNEVDDSIFKGKKLTMVNIWATFCRPCIGEMPDLQKISEDYAEMGVQVIGIVSDVQGTDDAELIALAKDIEADTGVKYTSLVPSESLVEAKLGEVYSVPETIFLDENGNQIGESYIGSRSYDSWSMVIDSMLSQVNSD